MNSSNSIVI